MTVKIWKFVLPEDESFAVDMPDGAELLTVQMQHNRPCLWVKVVPGSAIRKRNLRWAVTGQSAPNGTYIGTIQDGVFVFHLFDQGFSE